VVSKSTWHLRDKWKRHLALIGIRGLSRHIPPTKLLNKGNLTKFLKRYKVIFVKPVYGAFGKNVTKITLDEDVGIVQRESKKKEVPLEAIPRLVRRHVGNQRYMIQKGVSLIEINGRPVDYRILLLRTDEKWNIMGVMGKVATGNRIVTNFSHGGRPIQFKKSLLRADCSEEEIDLLKTRMYRLALIAARKFTQRYKHCRKLGIDMALDKQKKIWILEVNTSPGFNLFKYHEDQTLYGRIKRDMKRIGKLQSKK
jgi:glutathione synthase/RimK-type ligase-like ATP-grasp enzyme